MSPKVMKLAKLIYMLAFLSIISLLHGCSSWQTACTTLEEQPRIFPDYTGTTLPVNIAPVNFMLEGTERIQAEFSYEGESLLKVTGRKGILSIPLEEWHSMLCANAGKKLHVTVSEWSERYPQGAEYKPFEIKIAEDPIDSWIAYRLIEPGYIEYRQMGIYQRDLASFDESAIITNRKSANSCVNCHNFPSYSPESLMFHARGNNGGTILYNKGKLDKIDFRKTGFGRNTTYPAWHPDGQVIAFSSNTTHQIFYAQDKQEIEVFDTASDLVLYDIERGETITDKRFTTEDVLETFPTWSPDGKYLYFTSYKALSLPVRFSPEIQYDLVRVAYDPDTRTFGEQIDTLFNSRKAGGSASYPRISPDGQYLLYTWAKWGTFPIWHHEADMRMIDLTTDETVDISLWNSSDSADSYHSWSSNGRWVIYGTRRADNRYTRLYIGYWDKNGKAHKPFLLPQEDPRENIWRLKSFNVPEFISGKVDVPEDVAAMF